MADNDAGDKTEKPTSKRLEDARKKGDVSKSRELTSTAGLILWLALGSAITGYSLLRLTVLFESSFDTIELGWAGAGYTGALRTVGMQAVEAGVLLSLMMLVPASIVGSFTDFMQVGPILAFDKVTPKMENLDPAGGVKRMFSMDNLIEVLKALGKTVLLFVLGWLIVRSVLPQLVLLAGAPDAPIAAVGDMIWSLTLKLMLWTIALFAGISLLDASYQQYSFTKKMKMSMRDLKEEAKSTEGNPEIKNQRRQAHREWSEQSNVQAARDANVLVVNPTHIAIAIDYDTESNPVPTIGAMGEGDLARQMREAAEKAGTPIVRNIPLARDLLGRADVGEIVPSDLFDIIAEVILWARQARERVEQERESALNPLATAPDREARVSAPGEDLTHYKPDPGEPGHRQGLH